MCTLEERLKPLQDECNVITYEYDQLKKEYADKCEQIVRTAASDTYFITLSKLCQLTDIGLHFQCASQQL